MERGERQAIAADKWKQNGGIGGVIGFTGFGKTRLAIEKIIEPTLNKIKGRTCIIVTHRVALVQQWERELQMIPELKEFIQVMTKDKVVSMGHKIETTLLIVDEVSEMYGEIEKGVWNGTFINYKFFLWLDATPKDSAGIHKELYNIAPVIDEITREEGKKYNWLTNCFQFNIGIDLTEDENKEYIELSKSIGDLMGKFGTDFDLAKRCLSGEKDNYGQYLTNIECSTAHAKSLGWHETYPGIARGAKPYYMDIDDYRLVIDINNQWHPEKIIGYSAQLFEDVRKRYYLLHKAKNKYIKALEIAEHLRDYKIVYFSQSTEFAHGLYERLNEKELGGCVEYHSNIESRPLKTNLSGNPSLFGTGDYIRIKSKKSENFGEPKTFGADTIKKLSLEAYLNNECRILSLGCALDKGLDVPDIGVGVITSQSNNKNQYTQRKGRTTRLSDGKEVSLLICVYAKDTIDVSYLRNVQRGTDGEIFWINDVSEITLNPVREEEFDGELIDLL